MNDVAAAATRSLFDDDADIDPNLLADLAATHAKATGLSVDPTCEATVAPGPEPTAVATCDGTATFIFRPALGLDLSVAIEATETSLLDTG